MHKVLTVNKKSFLQNNNDNDKKWILMFQVNQWQLKCSLLILTNKIEFFQKDWPLFSTFNRFLCTFFPLNGQSSLSCPKKFCRRPLLTLGKVIIRGGVIANFRKFPHPFPFANATPSPSIKNFSYNPTLRLSPLIC